MEFTIEGFGEMYQRCFARAMGLAVTLLHDEEDARDIVQEVFARLWESLRSSRLSRETILTPEAFLYRSVRNACLNHIEKMETRERIRRLLPLDDAGLTELSESAAFEERIAAVRTAADMLLSERENAVIHEVFSHGHSYREAATRLGVSTSAINKHIVNALRKLRNHLKNTES